MQATDGGGLPLHAAAHGGHAAVVQLLVDAAPAAAMAADVAGSVPLHWAAERGHAAVVQLLLNAAPAAATAADVDGDLPLHLAAQEGHAAVVQLLLDAAPAAASVATEIGWLPLHDAAFCGHAMVVQLLLTAAPETVCIATANDSTALDCSLEGLGQGTAGCEAAARCLAAAAPAHAALTALAAAGAPARPLIADCVAAHLPSTDAEWQLVPAACPGLGRALPAALERSAAQAAQVVQHLPAADKQRLRTATLCLLRAQRATCVALPGEVARRVVALFDG